MIKILRRPYKSINLISLAILETISVYKEGSSSALERQAVEHDAVTGYVSQEENQ
jgi:hypothetical protein